MMLLKTKLKDWWVDTDGMACLDVRALPQPPVDLIDCEVVITDVGDATIDHPVARALRSGHIRVETRN